MTTDEILAYKIAHNKAGKASRAKSVPARKSAITQNNFSKELTADELLDYKLAQNKTKKLKSGPKAIADGEPERVKVPVAEAPKTEVAPKLAGTRKEVIDLAPKRSRTRGPTVPELINQIKAMGDKRSKSELRRQGKDKLMEWVNRKTTIETKRRARTSSRSRRTAVKG